MDIAIIGAGNVGRALATSFVRAGHTVTIASRDPEDAGSVAAATGATVAASNADAVAARRRRRPRRPVRQRRGHRGRDRRRRRGQGRRRRHATGCRSAPNGPDIDTTHVERRGTRRAPSRRADVVKAFNTLFASNQSDPIAEGVQLDGYVAGDDAAAKATVLELVELDRPRSRSMSVRWPAPASSRASPSSTSP